MERLGRTDRRGLPTGRGRRALSRPRIGVDLRALVPEPTGIGVATESILGALTRRDTFDYVGLAHAPIARERLDAAGVECEIDPTALGVVWQQLRLPKRLRRGDLDLFWSPLLTLPWRLPCPGVVTIHDLTPLLFPEMHRAKVRWSVRPFLGRTVRTASSIAVDSAATAGDVAARFPAGAAKTVVVPMGVSETYRPGTDGEIRSTREELDCPEGYLLHVGTLEPRKNVGRLVDAWLARREADPQTPPLVLAGGSGWRTGALSERIDTLAGAGLRRVGRVSGERLAALYRAATGFVFPSLYEGFGLPPLEAMASGVPVAVSDRSSLPEVVGDTGLLFDPESVDAIAAALERLVRRDEETSRRIARALDRAAEFTWDRAAERMESIFEGVLSLQSPARRR